MTRKESQYEQTLTDSFTRKLNFIQQVMLNKLFISKVRVKMLSQYMFNKDQEYHVRGLVRILDEEINAVRRELQNLEAAGILISKKKGNKLFYKLNETSIYSNELTKLLYKDREDISHIHKHLSKIEGIETALITENYLTNNYEQENDIDLLILSNLNPNDLAEVVKKIETALERILRVTVIKPKDIEFHHKRRDPFLLNILRGDKIMLIGNESDLI